MPIEFALHELTAKVVSQGRCDNCYKGQHYYTEAIVINRQQVDYAQEGQQSCKSGVFGCFGVFVDRNGDYRPLGENI